MMERSSLTALAILAFVLAGCATKTQVRPTTAARTFAPVCLEGVAVYDDFSSVPRDYREVALITAEQSAVYADKTQMVTEMRKKSGEQGGNALVINNINATKSTAKLIGEALGANSAERQGKAVAIYMPGDSMRVKNACGTT